MAYLHAAADRSRWDTPDKMVRACVFLASQGDGGVTGLVATDEEICERYLNEEQAAKEEGNGAGSCPEDVRG